MCGYYSGIKHVSSCFLFVKLGDGGTVFFSAETVKSVIVFVIPDWSQREVCRVRVPLSQGLADKD